MPRSPWRCCTAPSLSTGRSPRPGSTSPRTACTRPRSTAAAWAITSSPPAGPRYRHRLRYQTFDVTDLLRDGRQRHRRDLWARAGTRGRLGFDGGRRNLYGERRALLAQLEITHADGTRHDRRHRRALACRRPDRSCVRALRRRGLRRPVGSRPAGRRRASTTPTGRGHGTARPRAELVAPTGPPVRRTADRGPGRGHHAHRPGRPLSTSARTWSDVCAIRVSGPAGHDDHPAARRGAGARRTRHQALALGRRHRHATRCAGEGVETVGTPASPSTASATPRSTSWPGELDRGRRRQRSSCTPT